MIIASDLDRTLIYSTRALEEFGYPANTLLEPVERVEGKIVAYMTKTSYNILKVINDSFYFIPVTTRTTEQFKRIFIFNHEIPIKYAITSNGATILEHGKPIKEWSEYMDSKLKSDTAQPDEVLACLHQESISLNGRLKQVEGLFFYFILEEIPTDTEIFTLIEITSKFGWRISLQGRKLYFIPKAINKGDALQFICSREKKMAIAGAGDSILDLDFLKICRHQFVPNHGELSKRTHGFTLTRDKGILAAEEILQQCLLLQHSEV